jgi:chemotaxis protein methyltransferase CheR
MSSSTAFKISSATMSAMDPWGSDHGKLQGDIDGFMLLSRFLKERCGIDLPLTPKNQSLMASRMRKVLVARNLTGYAEYAALLSANAPGAVNEFVSALTTNTTHFFREAEHFEHFRKSLPALIEAKKKAGVNELRIWCAASSTGQEPYTILMSLLESGALPQGFSLKFLATDIDLRVLERASKAIYRFDDVENVPPALLSKYFEQGTTKDGQVYRLQSRYAQMIRFARLNLIESNWPFQHKFDVIFCRNVLIYFDSPTAQATVERLAEQLNPGGILYLGHSECGHVKTRLVKTMIAAAYQRVTVPVSGGGR